MQIARPSDFPHSPRSMRAQAEAFGLFARINRVSYGNSCAVANGGEIGLELIVGSLSRKTMRETKLVDFAVFDELIWPADANNRSAETQLTEGFKDGGAEAS